MQLKGYELIKAIYLLLDDGDGRFLRHYDLTQAQFYALLWLEGTPKSMSQLSKDMLCDPSNITRVATILERKGLIIRQRSTKDRRVINLTLTGEGERLCHEARLAHELYTNGRMDILTIAEQTHLLALLNKLSDGLQQQLQYHQDISTRA